MHFCVHSEYVAASIKQGGTANSAHLAPAPLKHTDLNVKTVKLKKCLWFYRGLWVRLTTSREFTGLKILSSSPFVLVFLLS